MKKPKWLLPETVVAVQNALLSEHGGEPGIREEALFESALARPQQKYDYEPASTVFELAAAYSFGLAKNHPFIDGNKRIALTAALIFLEINSVELDAPEVEAAAIFESLAAGRTSEKELANWFRFHAEKA